MFDHCFTLNIHRVVSTQGIFVKIDNTVNYFREWIPLTLMSQPCLGNHTWLCCSSKSSDFEEQWLHTLLYYSNYNHQGGKNTSWTTQITDLRKDNTPCSGKLQLDLKTIIFKCRDYAGYLSSIVLTMLYYQFKVAV